MEMVRRELTEHPEIDNATLFEKALEIDPAGMEGVDRRQFNARYPLQVKRREMGPRPPRARGPAKSRRSRARTAAGEGAAPADAPPSALRPAARDGVREVLLRFAQDLANAESRGEVVAVLAGVDGYVDRILGVGGSPK